jgi:hypothetical protein
VLFRIVFRMDYRIVQHLILFGWGSIIIFINVLLLLLYQMNHPRYAIVYVIFVILYTVDTFNSFWRNQTLIETIVMRKNVIDRNVIEDINY